MTSCCPAMRSLLLLRGCLLLLVVGFRSGLALPISAAAAAARGTNESSQHWEVNWLKISLGLLSVTVTAFTLVGCLCCRRNRRPKGFEDCAGSVNKEFKDGSSIDNDASLPQLQGLELQVPVTPSERVQFEPLPVERFVPEICVTPRPKIPTTISVVDDDGESERSTLQDSCQEWFQKTDLHVPRDKLKYLREIGHGWFGKVVEGCADLQDSRLSKPNAKSSNVVVRILTEEATAKEKAWFLGEATPYFKLRHRNILSLFGSCLETDPYLLLFESCPLGDLKSFLRTNRESEKALVKENLPTRIAIEVGAGLRHMHEHGLAHTDLAARNCLVASDLSIKLGDYGMGVEKYPGDYYVLGDRALPIRWSAPESVECTETTIETREITARANLWSYAVLLWEIATWGTRPYDDLEDEKVIEMLLSSKSGMKPVGSQLLLQNCDNCASNLVEAMKTCLVLEPEKRLPLEKVRHVLLKDQLESETSDFEQRWENLRPNASNTQTRSASLQDLRGSLDSEQWPSLTQTSFRLGPEEPVKNVPGNLLRPRWPFRDSDSETEEESWRGRVERGAYTEKVKQKSKSVADLMVLVHIEPDSDADMSLGPPSILQVQLGEKAKKRISMTGSDGDLPSAVFDDQFDQALRKLRDPLIPGNSIRGGKGVTTNTGAKRPKLLSLTIDQGQYPIAKLANNDVRLDQKQRRAESIQKCARQIDSETIAHKPPREHLLQLVKNQRHQGDLATKESQMAVNEEELEVPAGVQVTDLDEDINDTRQTNEHAANTVDVNAWSDALETTLKEKTTSCTNAFASPINKIEATNEETITPSPQSRAEYSAEDAEDEYSEDLPGLSKRHLPMDDEDDRKRMSTPDDERSSDSGFRDKESCEEEESPLPGPPPNLVMGTASQPNTPRSAPPPHDSAEEEQLRILFELDTILDAECYALADSLEPSIGRIVLQEPESSMANVAHKETEQENETSAQSSSETTGETEKEIVQHDKSSSDDTNISCNAVLDSQHIESDYGPVDSAHRAALLNEDLNSSAQILSESSSWPCLVSLDNNEDEDSSTMSLRSDNSYVPFSMDDEFVAAIRNELREKLPQAQMSVVEAQELRDDDEPSLVSDVDSKNWEDELEDELADRTGVVDIAIRYNTFGTPLSPILEERESAGNSDSLNLTRDDVSTASKGDSNTLSEDDVLMIDTQTNRATIVEGGSLHSQESQEFSNREISDIENNLATTNPSDHHHHQQQHQHHNPSYLMDRRPSSGSGAPLPSPEDEACKWQQLPPQLQENLMSTSFTSEQDWDSEEELPSESAINEVEVEDDDEDEDEGEDGVMDEDEEEETSSSSGEFVWQVSNAQYGATAHLESHETESPQKAETAKSDTTTPATEEAENDEDLGSEDEDEDDGEEEEEFTPSAWDATLAPHRSALRSPDKKTMKSGDQKKSVWFKKQRYHCVYEYPKETPPTENPSPTIAGWEPTSYADWEEMIDNIDRLNFQPMDYFESSNTRGDDEFFVSSSNRPFQFQSGNGKFVSQFFPGASGSGSSTALPEAPAPQSNQDTSLPQTPQVLGELRHTRDRLKLNLTSSSNGSNNRAATHHRRSKRDLFDDHDDDDDEANENQTARDEENNVKAAEDTKQTDDDGNKPLVKTSPSEEQCTSEPKSNDLDADLA